jgi:DNA-nicking Smr family endonuclease
MSGRPPKKTLSEDDRALWKEVTGSVRPLRVRRERAGETTTPRGDDAAPEGAEAKAPPPPREPVAPFLPPYVPHTARKPRQPGRIDEPTLRKLKSGKRRIDCRIDLHGMTEAVAHDRLLAFLERERREGNRLALVITGKGAFTGGILRQSVPRWFAEHRFSQVVGSWTSAHAEHGGEGAIYVRLRRDRPGGPVS